MIDLSSILSVFEVSSAVTEMIFPCQTTVVDSYTGRVLAVDAATVAMLVGTQ